MLEWLWMGAWVVWRVLSLIRSGVRVWVGICGWGQLWSTERWERGIYNGIPGLGLLNICSRNFGLRFLGAQTRRLLGRGFERVLGTLRMRARGATRTAGGGLTSYAFGAGRWGRQCCKRAEWLTTFTASGEKFAIFVMWLLGLQWHKRDCLFWD